VIYYTAYFFLKTLSKIFFPLTVSGREHLPEKEGFVIASNHVSNLDPFILGLASRRRLSYVTKGTLFRNKVLSFLLYRVDAFPIKRGEPDFRAMRETLRRLKQGRVVVLFPEGTRKKGDATQKVQEGIGFIAAKSAVAVVPAYIEGSDRVLAPGSRALRRSRVTVTFGPPLRFTAGEPYAAIASHIMERILLLHPQPAPGISV
jgi:1-acyl-sn-glycerol-3-phosphate acyltransferase